jgi:CCR4-NOT transcription complex subunit 7/8
MHPSNEECRIREVWNHNLQDEFRHIHQIVLAYNYVAMDSEFPGVVAHPIGEFYSPADNQYQLLKWNVDLLKIIQQSLSFLNKDTLHYFFKFLNRETILCAE